MQSLETKPILIDIRDITLRTTAEDFERLCQNNPDLRLELTSTGELITMAPAGYESSRINGSLIAKIFNWNEIERLGDVFDSSGGFTLLNGAIRSPDVTWIEKSKLANISADIAFPQVTPDFVVELRSKTENLKTLREKMIEYRTNSVRLGWLINPQQQQVEIYRLGQEVEIIQSPTTLSGEDILPGFILELSSIW